MAWRTIWFWRMKPKALDEGSVLRSQNVRRTAGGLNRVMSIGRIVLKRGSTSAEVPMSPENAGYRWGWFNTEAWAPVTAVMRTR
jgi:hypothetical protein